MVSRRNDSNGLQSKKGRGIPQRPFLSRRNRETDVGNTNTSTKLRSVRRFSLRGNKTQPLLKYSGEEEEASAELFKSGPMETPIGDFKDGAVTSDDKSTSNMPSVLENLKLLLPIEEEDSEKETVVLKRHNAPELIFLCGCFEAP